MRLEDGEKNLENEGQGDGERDFQVCMTGPMKKDLGKCAWCHLLKVTMGYSSSCAY